MKYSTNHCEYSSIYSKYSTIIIFSNYQSLISVFNMSIKIMSNMKSLKIIFGSILSIFISINLVQSQTTYTVIDGGSETSSSGPTYNYYNYGLYQNIYTSSEIGSGAGLISALQWEWDGSSNMARTVNIYMGNTAKSSFSGTSDQVPLSELTLVYSGSINYSGWTWRQINLTSSFNYTGGNLVIAIDDNTGSYYNSSNRRFKSLSTGSYRTLYFYSDNTNPSFSSPTYTSISTYVPSLKLVIAPIPNCVSNSSPSDGATEQAYDGSLNLSWDASANANSYDVYFGTLSDLLGAGLPLVSNDQVGTSYTPVGLNSSTTYYWKVVPSGTGGEASGCSTISFATQDVVPVISTSGSLAAFSGCSGSPSTSDSFTISGEDMEAGITVSAPSGFEVSADNSSFSSSLVVGSSGTIASTTIYVRLTNSASGAPTGDVSCSSTNATTINISASGSVNDSPTGVSASSSPSAVCSGTTVNLNGSGNSSTDVTLGSNEATLNFPFRTLYEDARTEIIYKKSDLNNAGISGACTITAFSFYVTTANSYPMNNFSVKMQNGNKALYTPPADFVSSGWSNVYSSTESISATGWHTITLDSPFSWNGTQNLLIQICFDNTDWAGDTEIAYWNTGENYRMLYAETDGSAGCSLTAEWLNAYVPQIKFTAESNNPYSWSSDVGSFSSSSQNPTSNSLSETTVYTLTVVL